MVIVRSSANEFTFYLACATQEKHHDHTYVKSTYTHPIITHDHCYSKKPIEFTIDMEYADDMTIISTNPNTIEYKRKHLPQLLKESDLTINAEKSEYYVIKRKGDDQWKKCKLLGSLLDRHWL